MELIGDSINTQQLSLTSTHAPTIWVLKATEPTRPDESFAHFQQYSFDCVCSPHLLLTFLHNQSMDNA